jgi:hypothetical protein
VPSSRVTDSRVSLNVSDVVGQDGDEPGFIAHTGLAESGGLPLTTGRIIDRIAGEVTQ